MGHRKSLAGDSFLKTSMENYFSRRLIDPNGRDDESFGSVFSKYFVKGSVLSNHDLNNIDEEDSSSQLYSSDE